LVLLVLAGCSSNGGNGEQDGSDNLDADGGGADPGADPGPGDPGPGDTGPGDTGPGDTGPGDTGPGDTGPQYTFEFEVGHDDGIPALIMKASPNWIGQCRISPPADRLPVKLKAVKFIPASSFSGTLQILQDNGGTPGANLGQINYDFLAGDLGQWTSVDLSSLDIVASGDFWVSVRFPNSLTPLQDSMYGTTSSTGRCRVLAPGYPPYTANFDQITRAVVLSANDDALPIPGADGDPCTNGLGCQSGFCSGSRCSIGCTGGACGAGRRCNTFAGGEICVTECSVDGDCPTEAFCLTESTFFNPAGFCIADGPLASGADCQYHYHSICSTGYCSACDNDPTQCADPGTCQNP
jgi:hypothetical protein